MLKAESNNKEIPEMTQRIAQAAFPKGNTYMKMRDEMGTIFTDEEFIDLYSTTGQPAVSPWRLAMITVMQYVENLTDRQAAEAVRARIDWKYALGMELEDAGFNYSVLSEFRQRLIAGGEEEIVLTKMLEKLKKRGFLKGKHVQRTDATHVIAKIRRMNRLELVGETMRRVLDDIAEETPEWLKERIEPEWIERYGKRFDTYRLPKSEDAQKKLAQCIGEDGCKLMNAVNEDNVPEELSELASLKIMRRIWMQQYYLEDDKVHWRSKKKWGVPPARKMIASPDELDARYGSKGGTTWTGYKAHLTETCDTSYPRVITHVETTLATTNDVNVTQKIQEQLASRGTSPEKHLVDAGYVDLDVILNSWDHGIDLIGPVGENRSWQTKVEGGYDHTKFKIDWQTMKATCPQGKISSSKIFRKARDENTIIHFRFSKSDCAACVSRPLCTRSKDGRSIAVFPQEKYKTLLEIRQRQSTEAFKKLYQPRAGAEGTISRAVNSQGIRRARYRGLDRTHFQHLATAAAINFARIADWLLGGRPDTTRISHFRSLALQT